MIRKFILIAAMLFNADAQADEDQAPQSLGDALGQSSFDVNFRLRYEQVDEQAFSEDAAASTLRSRATWTSAPLYGWQLLAELDNVAAIGAEQFNSTANGNSEYPVVADPNGSEVNRAQLSYRTEAALLTLGRQRINQDNQRFIGGVGWRQNEQTFDALRAQLDLSAKFSVDYSFMWNVNRIFGPEGDNADLRGNLHGLRLGYQLAPAHSLAFFHYSLDFDDAPALSNHSSGVHYQGKSRLLNWQLSAATQSDLGDNSSDYSARYYLAELASQPLGEKAKVTLAAGSEWLRADAEGRFITPLATLHKFQGFADKFLNTPADGLRDNYLRASSSPAGTALANAKLEVSYHQYRADSVSADYGDELDLAISYALTQKIGLLAKAARYRADQWGSDTNKFWLAVTFDI